MDIEKLKELEKKYHLQISRDDESFNKNYYKTIDVKKYLENKDIPEETKKQYILYFDEMKKLTRGATNFIFRGDLSGEKETDWNIFYAYHFIHEHSKENIDFIKAICPEKYEQSTNIYSIQNIFESPKEEREKEKEQVTKSMNMIFEVYSEIIYPALYKIKQMISEDLEKMKKEIEEEKDAESVL